jgi:hypothetical protein
MLLVSSVCCGFDQVLAYHCKVSITPDASQKRAYKKSSTTVDTSLFSSHTILQYSELTSLVHHSLHWHMGHTLQLVIDDQLRNKLDETKHVDCLSEGSDDERIPSSMSLVHDYCQLGNRNPGTKSIREYPVYPAKRGMAPYETSRNAS